MRTRLLAVAMTVCIPAIAFAQKGGGSGPGSDPAPSRAAISSVKAPSSRDLADLNPAALLSDKLKKALRSDTTAAILLKNLVKQIDDHNKAFFASYDSVRRWTMPPSDNVPARSTRSSAAPSQQQMQTISPAEEAKMQASMRDLRILLVEFKVRRKADSDEAFKLIPEAQKQAAADLLMKQDAELDKLIGGRP
jgi:hypothetical protein